MESKVKLNQGFKNSLQQQVSEDEEYTEIMQQLQDLAQAKEITDQSQHKFHIKEGVLKVHQEEQNKTYNYWRTVILDNQELKMQILRELHCVPYFGHPGYNRTLELAKQNFYW